MKRYNKLLLTTIFFGGTGALVNALLEVDVYSGAIIGLLFFNIMKDEIVK